MMPTKALDITTRNSVCGEGLRGDSSLSRKRGIQLAATKAGPGSALARLTTALTKHSSLMPLPPKTPPSSLVSARCFRCRVPPREDGAAHGGSSRIHVSLMMTWPCPLTPLALLREDRAGCGSAGTTMIVTAMELFKVPPPGTGSRCGCRKRVVDLVRSLDAVKQIISVTSIHLNGSQGQVAAGERPCEDAHQGAQNHHQEVCLWQRSGVSATR